MDVLIVLHRIIVGGATLDVFLEMRRDPRITKFLVNSGCTIQHLVIALIVWNLPLVLFVRSNPIVDGARKPTMKKKHVFWALLRIGILIVLQKIGLLPKKNVQVCDISLDNSEEWMANGHHDLLVSPPCSEYTNCTSCIGDVNEHCGWCKSDSMCISRNKQNRCSDFQEYSCNGWFLFLALLLLLTG